MWSNKILKSSVSILLCLSLVGCNNQKTATSKKKPTTPSVVSEQAEVTVNNAAELESFHEKDGDDSYIMVPQPKHTFYFALNSSQLGDDAKAALREVRAYLTSNKHTKVLLSGHADIRGTQEYNLPLSKERVQSVANELGLKSSQIKMSWYGKSRPVASGHSERAHAKNRRVELAYQSVLPA